MVSSFFGIGAILIGVILAQIVFGHQATSKQNLWDLSKHLRPTKEVSPHGCGRPLELEWGGVPALRTLPPSTWVFAAISGLGQYALPFWLYHITLKYLPTSSASLFLILIPVCSIGGVALFLGERLMVISLVVSSSQEGCVQQK